MAKIEWHDSIHGFRTGRGTGTAILETKLHMQLAQRGNKPLYQIFLDLSKAYDALDRGRTLEILAAYGVGENVLRLLANFWNEHKATPRQEGCYGDPIDVGRGCTQGDVDSPTIFNVVVDAILRAHDVIFTSGNSTEAQDAWDTLMTLFYADDGQLTGKDPETIQRSYDIFIDLFGRMGLKMKATKTQAMIMTGAKPIHHIPTKQYMHMKAGIWMDCREAKREKVTCTICEKSLRIASMRKHMRDQHHTIYKPTDEHEGSDVEGYMDENDENAEDRECVNYHIELENYADRVKCPRPNCGIMISTNKGIRRHFR